MKFTPRQRLWSLITIIGILVSGLTYVVTAGSVADPSLTDMTTFVFNGNTVTVTNGNDTNYEVVVYDSTDVDSAATATASGSSTVYSVPDGSSGELKVAIKKAGGSYVFKGNGNGNITVKKAATGDANLYLNGLNLTSSFTSVITVNKDSTAKCKIHIIGGTTNTLTDAALNNGDTNTANLAAENAVLKFKAASNVTITGNGTLNINGNAKNGIKANNLFTIEGNVKMNITAADDGMSSEATVTVNAGIINITSKAGDGIKCGADDAATGDIIINGGTITIDAYGDGMQATANLTVNGGVLDITCYGGYTASYNSTTAPSAKGLKAGGTYLDTSGTEVSATECQLTINGGFITVNSADDAIHSDKDVTITAGVLDLYTAGDGVHADYTNTIGAQGADNTDLYLTIHKCYEGIEGANIYIHSGIINVFASDDSINAANSDLGSSAPGGFGGSSSFTFTVDITGGFIYCASSAGDCLDSNKNFTISGGTLVVLGSLTQQDNTAVDTDGSFNIQGGEILTIGKSGMLTNPTTTQSYCTWTSAGTVTASASGSTGSGNNQRPGQIQRPGMGGSSSGSGSVVSNNKQITITDASGNVLISVAVEWDTTSSGSANYVLYSSPELTSGSSYTLTVGTIESVTGGSNITNPSVPVQPETPETDESPVASSTPSSSTASSTPSSAVSSAPVSSAPSSVPSKPAASSTTSSTTSTGTVTPPPTPPENPLSIRFGDTNQDGSVNATDALYVLQAAVNKRTLNEIQTTVSDVNGDKAINASDALLILQHSVQIITVFPVEIPS